MADHNDGDDEDGPATEPGDPSDLGNVVHGPWWVEGECPSASIFAEYLDDCLPEPQRQRVYDHLCECSRCRHDRTLIIALLLEIASLGDEGLERAKGVARTSLRVLVGPWADMAKTNDDERDAREADPAIPAADEAVLVSAVPPTRSRHTVTVALTAACLAALVAGGSVFFLGPRASVQGDRPARAASAQISRPLVARFTGRFPWAPVTARNGGASANYDRFLPSDAVRYLLTAERRGKPPEAPNPSMLGMVGASQVLTGRVEPGVETLRRAAAADPRSAGLLSDLGAALLARAAGSEPSRMGVTAEVATDTRDADYPAALEAIERALELSPRLEEALFNRALALEQLQLWRAARKAWEAYLEVDADSPWEREARWRMAAITIPSRPDPVRIRSEIVTAAAAGGISDRLAELVTAHRQLTRRGVEEELLPGWGEAWLSGDLKEADRQVRVARAIAEEWETQTGDRTLHDAVAEIDTATGPALKALASGHQAYGQANRAFDAFDLEAAQAAAARAIAVLPRTSPAYTWAALVRLACIAYRNGEIGEEARELIASAAADPSSVGRAQWIVGLWLTKRGDPAAGLVAYRQARDAYERLDERDSIVWLQFLIGDAYARMGLSPAAWKYHRLAIAGAPALADGRLESMLVATATLAVVEGRNRVAVDLLDEALAQPDSRKPDQIAEAYLWRSQALRELGRVVEARSDFEHAAVWLARANPLERKYLTGELNLVAGLVEVDSRRAVARLSRSLAAFSESGPAWRLPGVLLARARAFLRTGDDAAADADLRRGLVLLRKSIGGNRQEIAWTPRPADREQLFDELVSLALRRGEPERALAIAEMSRENIWRTHPSRIPRRLEALGAAQIRNLLEAGTTVLYYEWLPNRVVLWRLRADGSQFVELPSKPAELAKLISTLATDLSAGAWTSATRTAAMRLYAALLHPATLNGGRLVIVPDGELHRLPFAALMDPGTRRFLLEEHELMIAPSASAFIDGHARWQGQTSPPSDALVVGDPLVDQVLLPGMRPLEGARREARMIATFYPHPELLLGGAATRSAFLAALGGKSVVHFAGHSIANDTNPGRSSLALADQGNGVDGLLTASEIARLDLTDTQAVVLSGCDTGVGEDGEGSLSVARAFLTAGAPDVVASLWPIADLPSIPLMTAFHRRLRAGERPAAALRGAQLELLRGPEPSLQSPSIWAAFEVFGG